MVVSKRFDINNAHLLDVAMSCGAYENLQSFLDPQAILQAVTDSLLRGKGGGGAPAGAKWKNVIAKKGRRFLAVNADESEPGTCKDKYILSLDPHLLIEGIILTSCAIEAKTAFVYIRGEYEKEYQILVNAIKEAKTAGILGDLEIVVYKGAGAYICGEKSALLESIEGKRGHPRLKPHDRKEPDHLFGSACLVNNVETIASVPFIVRSGAQAYKELGTKDSPGSMLFAVSGSVHTPCVVEQAFGMKMMDFINNFGGGVRGTLKAVIPGGASTVVLTKDEALEAKLDYESMRDLGTSLGTGGMIVIDESQSMPKLLENLLWFYTQESCGQCTPCREGCGWALKIVEKIVKGQGKLSDLAILKDICVMLDGKTICVFAPAVKNVIIGFITKFEDEFLALIEDAHAS